MRLVWDPYAWEDYTHWQKADRRILNGSTRSSMRPFAIPSEVSVNLGGSSTAPRVRGREGSLTSIASCTSLPVMTW